MKNYIYELTCTDDRGWGAYGAHALWGHLAEPQNRLFATAAAARKAMREMRNAGCWEVEKRNGDIVEDCPRLVIEKIAVHEYLWGDHDDDVVDRIISLHGGAIKRHTMPTSVAKFLVEKYSGAKRAWSRESANLAGASSTTHTAAFIAHAFSDRVDELMTLLKSRGITA